MGGSRLGLRDPVMRRNEWVRGDDAVLKLYQGRYFKALFKELVICDIMFRHWSRDERLKQARWNLKTTNPQILINFKG